MTGVSEIFLKGGWVMWPLLLLSILTWAVVFERAFLFLTVRPKLMRLGESILHSLKSGDFNAARQLCHTQKASISEIFLNALDTKKEKESIEKITERNRIRLLQVFKRNLWILGTIGSSAPFIGLLGTVLGIIRSFHSMAEKGAGGFSVVSGGISESLIATGAGLIVAITALITYNIFVTYANQTLTNLRLSLEEIIDEIPTSSKQQTPQPV